MKSRASSFTLVEIVVAMAIGATVLMISYGGFELLIKTNNKISQLRNSQLTLENGLSIIYSDFYSSEFIASIESGLVFNDQKRIIYYSNQSMGVVRNQLNLSDTFPSFKISLDQNDLIIHIKDQDPIRLEYPESAYANLKPLEN